MRIVKRNNELSKALYEISNTTGFEFVNQAGMKIIETSANSLLVDTLFINLKKIN